MLACFAPPSPRLPDHSTSPHMYSTATPKWLLAAGLAGLVAVPTSAQSAERALDLSDAAAPAATAPDFKLLLLGGLVQDGSFEATSDLASDNPFWDASEPFIIPGGATPFCTDECFNGGGGRARTGDWFAIMGFDGTGVAFIEQDVTVPSAGDYELTFYWRGGTFDVNQDGDIDDATGTLSASVGGQELYSTEPGAGAGYMEVRLPVTLSAGSQTVRIELDYANDFDNGDAVQVIIDDVSLGEPAPPPVGEELIVLETDDASLGVYSDARIGTDANGGAFTGPGFVFGDAQADGTALFTSVFVAGTSGTRLSGTSYDDQSDWVAEQDFTPIDAPDGFDEAFESVFNDSNAEDPLGLRVAQRAYSLSSDDDVSAGFVLEYVVENASAEQIDELYAGIFADWDVGVFQQNLAGFYDGTGVGLNYVYENGGGTNSAYYGVAALNEEVSGYGFDQVAGNDTPEGELEIFQALTTTAPTPTAPADRRTTTGVGPFDLAEGESVGVRFAFVGGTDAADIQANAEALAAAVQGLAFAPVPPPPPINATFDNGEISFQAFGDGFFGANSGEGEGFVFDGASGLFEGQFLVGLSASDVIGDPYDVGDYEVVESIRLIDTPAGFQDATEAIFASTDGSVEITEQTYVPNNGQFVILRYIVRNVSGGPLDGVYLGPFADFDLGSAAGNLGGYDAANRLAYVYDGETGEDTDYFGILSRPNITGVSGWSVSAGTDDDGLYTALSTAGAMDEAPADRRVVIGNGPFGLVDGQQVSMTYALVAGETLADLQAAAVQAQIAPIPSANEEPAEEIALAKTDLRVFPNPVAAQATVAFRAPAGTDARVVVYDVLGREVLRVADQMATDAEQRVQFSTSDLPAGLYLVRLTAGGTSAVQQVTVVR